MALRTLNRIHARIKQWLSKRGEAMKQWHKDSPGTYQAFMEEQQRNMRGGF